MTLLGNALALAAVSAVYNRPSTSRIPLILVACASVMAGVLALARVGTGGAPSQLFWFGVLVGGIGEGITLALFAELFSELPLQKILFVTGIQQAAAALPTMLLHDMSHLDPIVSIAALVLLQTALLVRLSLSKSHGANVQPFPEALPPWGSARNSLHVLICAALMAGLCYGVTMALTLAFTEEQLPAGNMLGALVGGTLLVASSLLFARKQPEDYLYQVAIPLLALGLASIPLLANDISAAMPILLAFSTYIFGLIWFFSAMLGASSGARAGHVSARIFLCFFIGHLCGRIALTFLPKSMVSASTVSACLLFLVVILLVTYISNRKKYEREIVSRAEELDLALGCNNVSKLYNLTPREQEVLRLLALGFTTKKIAEKLVLSQNSVNTHIRHIYAKLGVHSRSEIAELLDKPLPQSETPH